MGVPAADALARVQASLFDAADCDRCPLSPYRVLRSASYSKSALSMFFCTMAPSKLLCPNQKIASHGR